VVAIVGPGSLDVGRCMQNMMLAAWNDGVVSCPNGMPDPGPTAEALGLEGGEHPAIVLTFGYPVTGHTAEVVGKSKVGFYDYRDGPPVGDTDYTEVPAGGKYDLKARKVLK